MRGSDTGRFRDPSSAGRGEFFLDARGPAVRLAFAFPPGMTQFPKALRSLVTAILRRVCFVFGWLAFMVSVSAVAGVHHEPPQPRSGQEVRVRVDPGTTPPGDLVLEYQVVAPGHYVAKKDVQFEKGWMRLPLTRGPDGGATAEIPGAAQRNRNLIRYRVRSVDGKQVLLPPPKDSQPNYAYFVYDGVPDWRGAVNPQGEGAAREVRTFPARVLTNVPVYHLIASYRAVEEVQWKPRWDGSDGDDARHAYHQTGTVVADGVVYDHVPFRARGGGWRHAMGKNMWKFNFNPGHPFAARDEYGRPYAVPWDKLNLGACIQQGDYRMRGEQGMFEAVTFRLFNLAGTEAPRTHFVHLRVVTDETETPANQYRGDFWGLYLAVEEIEGEFLKEHGLSDGNLYKIEGYSGHPEHIAKGAPKDGSDVQEFLSQLLQGRRRFLPLRTPDLDAGWSDTVDLSRYYSYRSILEAVHHYDVGTGKNYFFYHNLADRRWQVIPWDVDLTWGDHMYGDGNEPFVASGILNRSPFRSAYQQRLAEIRDLLFNPDQTGRLIDEVAAHIWNGDSAPSLADADRAKWDYHPIMSSDLVMGGKSEPGLFYLRNPASRFGVMPALMKAYVQKRQRHIDRLLADYHPAAAPTLAGPKSAARTEGLLSVEIAAGTVPASGTLQWRLGEVTDPSAPGFVPGRPWHYEIETRWQTNTPAQSARIGVPIGELETGHSYRVRVRSLPGSGTPSRWSDPIEFVVR